MPNRNPENEEDVLGQTKKKLDKPPLFRVLLHNDNYTTMDFVVFILVYVFNRSEPEAISIMLQVHNQGVGLAGVYPYEVAETKISRVGALARENEYPLLCTMEQE